MAEKGFKIVYGVYTFSLLGLVVSAALNTGIGALVCIVLSAVLVVIMVIRFRHPMSQLSLQRFYPALGSGIAAVVLYLVLVLKEGWEIYARIVLAAGLGLAFWLSPILFVVCSLILIPLALPFMQQPVQAAPYQPPPYVQEVVIAQAIPESPISRTQGPYIVNLDVMARNTETQQSAPWYNAQADTELEIAITDLETAYQIDNPLVATFLRELHAELFGSATVDGKWAELLLGAEALAAGLVISKYVLGRFVETQQVAESPALGAFLPDAQVLSGFFERVPKSRLAEITYGTGLEKEKISALLELGKVYGQYTHEPACFWRPTTQEEVEGIAGAKLYTGYLTSEMTPLDLSPGMKSIFTDFNEFMNASKEPVMLDPTAIPILVQVLDFLFDETGKILKERRERRKKQDKAEEKKAAAQAATQTGEAIASKAAALSQMVRASAWQNAEKQVEGLLAQLGIYQDRYRHYKKQYAIYGEATVEYSVIHNLEEAEEGIEATAKELQAVLSKIYGKKVSIEGLEEHE